MKAEIKSQLTTVATWEESQALTLTKDDVRAGIALWLVRVNDIRRERKILKFGDANHHYDVTMEGGRRWLKMGAGPRVFCFVESSTGNIYKAANWKAPETNYPRGNVFVEDITEAEKRGGHYA
tara:strand:+ start:74 stop:442 length:369 start_codon:yes stop_codon:yes gene_type:complete